MVDIVAAAVDLVEWQNENCSVLLMGLTGKSTRGTEGYFSAFDSENAWFPLIEV
jgi:hypothetical protein